MVALVLSLGHVRQSRPAFASNPESWAALSNWRASTDDLLPTSTAALSGKFSTSTDSWIDDSPTTTTSQDQKL